MKEVKIDKETFLIKLVDGKLKIKNPHGEESSKEYEEIRNHLAGLFIPKENKDNK